MLATLKYFCMFEDTSHISLSDWPTAPQKIISSLDDIGQSGTIDLETLETLCACFTESSPKRFEARAKLEPYLKILITKAETAITSLAEAKKKTFKNVSKPVIEKMFDLFLNGDLTRRDLDGLDVADLTLAEVAKDSNVSFTEIELVLQKARKSARKFDPPIELGLDQNVLPEQRKVEPPKPIHHTYIKHLPPIVKGHSKWHCNPQKWNGSKPLRDVIFYNWLPYFAQNGCNEYSEQLKGMYYGMPSLYKKNLFLEKFSAKFQHVADEESFVSMCHTIADFFDKSNIQNATFFRKKWDSKNFARQRDTESPREFHDRIWEVFTLAHPVIFDQAEMRREFCKKWVKGLRNTKLYDHLKTKFLLKIKETAEIEFLVEKAEYWVDNQDFAEELDAERDSERSNVNMNHLSISNQHNNSQKFNNYNHRDHSYSKSNFRGKSNNNNQSFSTNRIQLNAEEQAQFVKLCYGKNYDKHNRKLITPLDEIPDFLKRQKGFDARNFIRDKDHLNSLKLKAKEIVGGTTSRSYKNDNFKPQNHGGKSKNRRKYQN